MSERLSYPASSLFTTICVTFLEQCGIAEVITVAGSLRPHGVAIRRPIHQLKR
jgi:hypothetical protein